MHTVTHAYTANSIGDEGADSIGEALETNTTLRTLDISRMCCAQTQTQKHA